MKKVIIIKKRPEGRYVARLNAKSIKESQFWNKIALEQQVLIHAKNNT